MKMDLNKQLVFFFLLFQFVNSHATLQDAAIGIINSDELQLEQAVVESFFELHSKFCCLWWGQNMCLRNDEWMATNCPNTCGSQICYVQLENDGAVVTKVLGNDFSNLIPPNAYETPAPFPPLPPFPNLDSFDPLVLATARPPSLPLRSTRFTQSPPAPGPGLAIGPNSMEDKNYDDKSGISLIEPPPAVKLYIEDTSGLDLDHPESIEQASLEIIEQSHSAEKAQLEEAIQNFDLVGSGPETVPLPIPPEFEDPETAGQLLSKHFSPDLMRKLDPNHKPGSAVILPYRFLPKRQDQAQFCCFWASLGFCNLNPEWMIKYCRQACAASSCRGYHGPEEFFEIHQNENFLSENLPVESNKEVVALTPQPPKLEEIEPEVVNKTQGITQRNENKLEESDLQLLDSQSSEEQTSKSDEIAVTYDDTLYPLNKDLRNLLEANLDSSSASLDEQKLCCFWASKGLCADNVEWMQSHCRSSCSPRGCATLSSIRPCVGPEICARYHDGKRYRRCSCDDDRWGPICSEKHPYPEGEGERCHGQSYSKSYFHRFYHF